MSSRNDLDDAYRASAYHVDGPAGRFALRIGAPSPEADALLTSFHASSWAFITAHNPGSVLLTSSVNAERHEQLVAEMARRGLLAWPGLSIGDTGSWPAEVGLFIPALSEPEAILLGQQFGQNAVVCGDQGGAARLCWVCPPSRLRAVFPVRHPD